MGERLPIIGVTARRYAPGNPFRNEAATAIQSAYLDAITRAGGLAVAVPPDPIDADQAAARVASLDALLLTGGVDVDPARYGHEPAPETYGVVDDLDQFEIAMLHAAIERATPVLAVCRGLQVVNVAFGGTLDQHITGRDGLGAHGIPAGGGGSTNEFVIEPESLLARVVGATTMSGQCHHHQAVADIGEGLVVSARTADGVIEGLELADDSPGPWLVAVQWHPEETAAVNAANQCLFDHLVQAALR